MSGFFQVLLVGNPLQPVLQGVVSSVLAALLLLMLGIFVPRLRQALFYKLHEYQIQYKDKVPANKWDIQWENHGLTVKFGVVHNNYIEDVQFQLRANGQKHQEAVWSVGADFIGPPGWPIHIKLGSILRAKGSGIDNEYTVYVVARVRRW